MTTATPGSDAPGVWRVDYPGGKPNDAQQAAHDCPAEEVLYGGAWAGGKTDWGIAETLKILTAYPGAGGLILRRTRPQLVQPGGIFPRLRSRLPRSAGRWSGNIFNFRNGSQLMLGHLNLGETDLENYLGGEFSVIFVDQAEQFLGPWLLKLAGRVRASGDLRDRFEADGFHGRLLLSANPGGASHAWLFDRFIRPWPAGHVIFRPEPTVEEPVPRTRAFIPASVLDNIENVGEDYKHKLDAMEEDDRRAAYGDWSVLRGSRFRSFSSLTHVVDPEQWPVPVGSGVLRVCAVDIGMVHPFAAIWIARLDVDPYGAPVDEGGMLVVYRELVQAGLTSAEQVDGILAAEQIGERGPGRPIPTTLSPDAWAKDRNTPSATAAVAGGRAQTAGRPGSDTPPAGSAAHHYWQGGLRAHRADNRRVEGWGALAARLRVRGDGRPRIVFHSTVPQLITVVPTLVRDPHRPEDVLKVDGDDAADALRYGIMWFDGRLAGHPPTAAEAARAARRDRRPVKPAGPAGMMRRVGF